MQTYHLVVHQPFAAIENETRARTDFKKGDVIADPETIAKIEKSPWARHVMRRAVPPELPRPDKKPAPAAAPQPASAAQLVDPRVPEDDTQHAA